MNRSPYSSRCRRWPGYAAGVALLCACGDDASTTDAGSAGSGSTGAAASSTSVAGTDTGADTTTSAGSTSTADSSEGSEGASSGDTSGSTGEGTGDSSGSDGGSTGALDCTVGDRVYQGDGCNFCDCTEAGLANCTARTCVPISDGCDYNDTHYAYAETFPSTDRCNECVCAASGLACTRREECVDGLEEGAILLESLDAPCGDIEEFTGQWLLDLAEPLSRTGPLDYENAGPLYPETLPDTTMTLRVHYEGGYVVCRIPAPGQEALDIEAIVEWQTEDGAFDEGQHTYLRRMYGGFLDAMTTVVTVEPGDIYGTYDHDCLDAGAIAFGPRLYDDDSADGIVTKTCEVDLGLTLGTWASPAP